MCAQTVSADCLCEPLNLPLTRKIFFWGILQFRKMVIRIGKSKKMFEKNTLKCYDNKVDIKQGEKVTYGL